MPYRLHGEVAPGSGSPPADEISDEYDHDESTERQADRDRHRVRDVAAAAVAGWNKQFSYLSRDDLTLIFHF